MNKEFVKKMIMAEALKYEAIKEIIPECMKKNLESFEKEAITTLKDVAFELLEQRSKVENNEEIKKETKKINVDFQ